MKKGKTVSFVTSGALAAAAFAGLFTGSAQAAIPTTGGIGSSTSPSQLAAGINASSVLNESHAGKHDCKGKNECKGQGGCKTESNSCKGQNACKGKGGCGGASEEDAVH